MNENLDYFFFKTDIFKAAHALAQQPSKDL